MALDQLDGLFRLYPFPIWYSIVPVTPLGMVPGSVVVPVMVRLPTHLVPEAGLVGVMIGGVVSRVKAWLVWLSLPEPAESWT